DLVALTTVLAEQVGDRHLQCLAEEIEQGRFDAGHDMHRDAQIEGLASTLLATIARQHLTSLIQHPLDVIDGCALDQRTTLLQPLENTLARRDFTHPAIAGIILENHDTTHEPGRMATAEVEQETIVTGDR